MVPKDWYLAIYKTSDQNMLNDTFQVVRKYTWFLFINMFPFVRLIHIKTHITDNKAEGKRVHVWTNGNSFRKYFHNDWVI